MSIRDVGHSLSYIQIPVIHANSCHSCKFMSFWPFMSIHVIHVSSCHSCQWGRFINKKRVEKNKNRGERQKNSENQVTLDSIFGASKKHYLSNFVLYML
jgi:hypothetical protein